MEAIKRYFPELNAVQLKQFEALEPLYRSWNSQINVISRKDMDAFYERHVLHALGIAKIIALTPKSRILDVGTGGGFPGIPLAIKFPEVQFHLVDSIGKKIKVVQAVVDELQLNNVVAEHQRAEKVKGQYDFIISRAVTRAERFVPWVQKKISNHQNNQKENGFLFLKGGDLDDEFAPLGKYFEIHALSKHFDEAFFETKKVVYLKK